MRPGTAPEPDWQDWVDLRTGRGRLPDGPGLYRIRIADGGPVVYIGQTGRSLRGRLGMLTGVYADDMPYADPHVAGPCLWALRHRDGCEFDVSTAVVTTPTPVRMADEALAVARHRHDHRVSPFANFGGMPAGYRKSTGNNQRLVTAGQRRRGGPDPTAPGTEPSCPPTGPLDSNPTGDTWLGLRWSAWQPAVSARHLDRVGVYRIRQPDADVLTYIGQGRVGARVGTHLAKQRGDNRQTAAFSGPLEVADAEPDNRTRRALLEIENDLIASHHLTTTRPPVAQFLG